MSDNFNDIPLLKTLYQDGNHNIEFSLDVKNETVWATTKKLAELFDIDETGITRHIKNVLNDNELDEKQTTAKFAVVQIEGKKEVEREVLHYNLDMVIAIGYRVNSRQATNFRKWATNIIKQYIAQGYVLNERRLSEDKTALLKLARDVRKLRSSTKNIYQSVRDVFKLCAIDYEESSVEVGKFYAKLQNKFYYAVCGTVRDGLLKRADASKFRMNAIACIDKYIDKEAAKNGANYLTGDELYLYHIVCEQFLLFAETKMLQGKKATMLELMTQFDRLIDLNGHQILTDDKMKQFYQLLGVKHAEKEFEIYKQNRKKEDDKIMKYQDFEIITQSLQELDKEINLSLPTQNIIEKINIKIKQAENLKSDKFIENIEKDNLEFKDTDFETEIQKIALSKTRKS